MLYIIPNIPLLWGNIPFFFLIAFLILLDIFNVFIYVFDLIKYIIDLIFSLHLNVYVFYLCICTMEVMRWLPSEVSNDCRGVQNEKLT